MTDCPECSDGRSSTGQVGMQRDGQPLVCPRCQGQGLVLRERDYSALYLNGRCVLCDTPAHAESAELHAAKHLETGEAVVQYDYRHTPRMERVLVTKDVPTSDAEGIGLWERDRTDANTENFRAAYALARDLNNQTRARIAKAAKEAK